MNADHDLLEHGLAALRRDSANLRTPDHVGQQLMDAFAARARRQRRQRLIRRVLAPLAGFGAIAATALWLVLAPGAAPGLAGEDRLLAAEGSAETPFIALASIEQIEMESAPRLLQADVPRSWLADAGLQVGPENAAELVRAEMLVGASDKPLAVRLLPLRL